jgi:hypothetical protein
MSDPMRMNYRALSGAEKAQMEQLKIQAQELHDYISSLGASRESAVSLTRLEECVMWAVKHLTGPK